MPTPAVTVVLPAFNRRDLLPRALRSVLEQSFADLELLVVDDGSTDGTPEVAEAVGDPRVRVIRLGVNRGQSVARNTGIAQARGRFIAFQDSDDAWLPGKLARQVDVLERKPEVAMVYGDLERVPVAGEPFVIRAPDLVRGRVMDDRSSGYAAYGLGIQTCCVRAGVFQSIGMFREAMRCFEDLEFFLRFTRRFGAERIPEPVVRYYETDGVSTVNGHEYAARRFLLRRFAWDILRQRPSWWWRERTNIRLQRRLDLP
ncbi:MAG TPA: glycosyltransferase family A protein [Kiritimatiellia bacterium]|nr:glycosyltransferase family A protein [Kiritimatiellia bacterium]HMP33287.1 glycosyltransferase family A protein [Kiritimatiellia bacterium]